LNKRFLQLWLLVVVMALSIHIGSYPLYDADEGRNGEVGREMAATNDYVMPRLDGMPYLDKPIVFFAAEAAAMEIIGPTELAARLPALLFTFATAALLMWFARRVWGAEEALVAAIAFLSMPLVLAFSRTVIFDSALSFFIVLAIVAFYFAVEERGRWSGVGAQESKAALSEESVTSEPRPPSPDPHRSRRWTILAWTAIGFGVLTKGPVAIALPLIVAIPYAIKRKAFRALWSWWGLIVFVVAVAPWVWAISLAVPDFLQYVLVTETAQRLATKALKRTGAPWYFVPYLVGGALPWSIVAFFAWRRERRDNAMLYVALWIVIPFLFFSLSQSKRPQYIVPVMPAVALAVAHFWRDERCAAAVRFAAIAILVLGVAVVAAPAILHQRAKIDPVIAAGVEASALPMGIAALAGAIAALVFAKRRDIALAALSLPIIAIPFTANPLLQSIGERRSEKALVSQIKPYLTPQTQVIGIESYTGSLSFYLGREIAVATPDGEEFTSNYIIRHYARFADDPRSSLRRPEWLLRNLDSCCAPRIYIIRSKDADHRAALAGRGIRQIASDEHFAAYGPWRGR
jgi:4-amino-4-deoxy-L-arabinose transferase-like glycosyltransferase